FQAEDGIRDFHVTGVQTCALPILAGEGEKPALPKQLETKDNTEPKLKVYIAEEKRVKEMAFEDYVAAVVGGEIKNDWPIEAIKRSEERRVGKESRSGR